MPNVEGAPLLSVCGIHTIRQTDGRAKNPSIWPNNWRMRYATVSVGKYTIITPVMAVEERVRLVRRPCGAGLTLLSVGESALFHKLPVA